MITSVTSSALMLARLTVSLMAIPPGSGAQSSAISIDVLHHQARATLLFRQNPAVTRVLVSHETSTASCRHWHENQQVRDRCSGSMRSRH